jgi:hypothetical protein
MTTLAVGNVTRLVKKRSHTSFLPIPPHANHTALIQSALRPERLFPAVEGPHRRGYQVDGTEKKSAFTLSRTIACS